MAEAVFYPDDVETHVERINPGANPAYIPGIMLGPQPTDRRPYRLTGHAKHSDVMLPPGTVVMLLPEEVESCHEPHGWEADKPEETKTEERS